MFFSTKPLGTVWSFENKNGLMIRNVRRTYHFRSEVLLQPGCWICDSRILDNYHSLYQQATHQQCISYLSCFYANTWQKQLRGGKVWLMAQSGMLGKCGGVDQFASHDHSLMVLSLSDLFHLPRPLLWVGATHIQDLSLSVNPLWRCFHQHIQRCGLES